MKTQLMRISSWFNPYHLGNKKIEKVHLYDKEGIQFSFNWFGSNNSYPLFELPFEVKNKRKIDFSSTGYGFVIKDVLYLPLAAFSHSSETEVEKLSYDKLTTSKYKTVDITFNLSKTGEEKDLKETKITLEQCVSSEQTDLGVKISSIQDTCKMLGCDLSVSQIKVLRGHGNMFNF